jgi:hypothetical protein
VLQRVQELCLHRHLQFADFIQKKRPTMRGFKQSYLSLPFATAEGARLITK